MPRIHVGHVREREDERTAGGQCDEVMRREADDERRGRAPGEDQHCLQLHPEPGLAGSLTNSSLQVNFFSSLLLSLYVF